MERTQISFDRRNAMSALSAAGRVRNQLNEFIEFVMDLGLSFGRELFEELVANGPTRIIEEYRRIVEKDVKGIRSKAAKAGTLDSADADIMEISKRYQQLIQLYKDELLNLRAAKAFDLGDFSFDEEMNSAIISQESIDRIFDRFKLYIDDEIEQRSYDLLLTLKEAWDELRNHYKENYAWVPDIHAKYSSAALCSDDENGYLVFEPAVVKMPKKGELLMAEAE